MSVRGDIDEFYGKQRDRIKEVMLAAEEFQRTHPVDKDSQLPYAQLQLRELDMKLREAMHRISDLCAVVAQSPAAAEEIVGGGQ